MHPRTLRRDKTIFIALPVEARKVIEWGCECSYCKAHPDQPAMWDTLAVNVCQKDGREDYATPIHYPEFASGAR